MQEEKNYFMSFRNLNPSNEYHISLFLPHNGELNK